MKVTIENKKGLAKDIKVVVDKKTMDTYLEERYEEVRKNYTLKGFRPGKAPREATWSCSLLPLELQPKATTE